MPDNFNDHTDLSAGEFLAYLGTDGQKWAEEFTKNINLWPASAALQAQVLSWFANAIEAGRTAGHAAAFEEMKHEVRNLGFDTSDFYTPGTLIDRIYQEIPGDHQCL